MIDVWVVIPTYDERENLPLVVARARAALAGVRPPVRGVLLVVDDSSPDGTGEIADRLAGAAADLHVLHRPAKAGLASAYRDGFAHALAAGADLVLEMDAD